MQKQMDKAQARMSLNVVQETPGEEVAMDTQGGGASDQKEAVEGDVIIEINAVRGVETDSAADSKTADSAN